MQVTVAPWDVFAALADESRMRILRLLLETGERICVCEFVDSLEIPQYTISKHLRVLCDKGLVQQEKEGRWVYFSLPDEAHNFVQSTYDSVKHAQSASFESDLREFRKRLKLRSKGKCLLGIQKEELIA